MKLGQVPEVLIALVWLLGGTKAQSSCDNALGMESGTIKDFQIQIAGSSSRSNPPHFARLNFNNYWAGNGNQLGVRVDLLNVTTVSKIALQGWGGYYTQTFAIHHSLDGLMWTEYKSSQYDGIGAEPLPGVVTYNNAPVNYTFIPTFEARFVVVQPLTYRYRPVIRMELYGCPSLSTAPVATTVNTDIVVSTEWTSPRSPYIISSMVTVSEGVTLTIRAGTSVIFTKISAGLIIDGELIVTGSLNQEVYLMSHNPSLVRTRQWQGIKDSKGVIKLSHAVIKNAINGLRSYASNTTISHTTFVKNEFAVDPLGGASDSSHVFIDNSNFVDNYRGVYIRQSFAPSSHFLIKNSRFHRNTFGFEMASVARVDIKLLRTRFTNNVRGLYANMNSGHCRFYGDELDFRDNTYRGIEYTHNIPSTTSPNNSFNLINSNFYQNRYSGLYLYIRPQYGVSTYTANIANNQFNGMSRVDYGVYFSFQPYYRSTASIRLDVSNNTFTAHNAHSLYVYVAENVRIASHLMIDGNHFSNSRKALYIRTMLKNTVKNTAKISRNAFYAMTHDPAVGFDMEGVIDATNNSFINCTSRVVLDVTRNAGNVTLAENIFSNPAAQINLRVNPRAFGRITKMNAGYNYWGYNNVGDVRRHISDFLTDMARVLVEITPWYTDPNRDVSSQDELIFDPRDACLGGILNSNVILTSHAVYNICWSIYIPPGYTLTIGQASQLVFRAGSGIFSEASKYPELPGSLKVIESPDNRTVFRSATTGQQSQWKGISIHNSANTQWNGVDIHNAIDGLTITFDKPTIISLTNLTVTGARRGVALTASSNGSLFIHESLFSSCLYRGIELTMTKLSKEFVFHVTDSRFLNNQGHAMYILHNPSVSARMVVNINNITGIGNRYGTFVQSRETITDLTLENCHFSRGRNYDFQAYILPRKIVVRKNQFISAQYGAYIVLNGYRHSEACKEGILLESNVFRNNAPYQYDVNLQLNARQYPSCSLRMIDNAFTHLSGRFKPAVYIDGHALVDITVANNSFTGYTGTNYHTLNMILNYRTHQAYIYGNSFNRGGHALQVAINEASAKLSVLSNTFTENREAGIVNLQTYHNRLPNPAIISGNTFTNNTGRVLISNREYFRLNYNVFNNPQADFNVALTGGTSTAVVNASFNFWGTTNKNDIRSKILDNSLNNNLPRVEFEPYMSGDNLTDIFVGITPFISPDGEIGGELIGNATLTLANSPYHAVTSIIIAKGAELTVEAGVVVECDENVAINVYGRLTCLGEGDTPVIFKSKGSKPWIGINMYSKYSVSQVRLQDGPNPWVGRLEVKMAGIWGTVCGDKFGMTDARVACAQLGYPRNKALLLAGQRRYAISDDTVPVLLHNVQCDGSETTLTDCIYSLPQGSRTCYHYRDVTLDCMSEPISDVRLSGTGAASVGRLELKVGDTWGTTCSLGFGQNSAIVACKQAGFPGKSVRILPNGRFPVSNNSMPIWFRDPRCTGSETTINDCPRPSYGDHTCRHYYDVTLSCDAKVDGVRLQGGPRRSMGRLEVSVDGLWGTVCTRRFSIQSAKVACLQAGYSGTNVRILSTNRYPVGLTSVPIILDYVQCSGKEKSLSNCRNNGFFITSGCSHSLDVNIDCDIDATTTPWTTISTSQGTAVTDGSTDIPNPLTEMPPLVTEEVPPPTEIPRRRRRRATQNDIFTSRLVNVLINNTQQGVRISGIIPEISNVTLTHSNADLLYIKTSSITPYIRLMNVSVYNAKRDGISIELQQTGNTDVTIVNSNVARAQRHCISLRNSGNFAIDSSKIYSCGQMAIHSSSYVKGHWQLTNSEMWDNYHYSLYMTSGNTQGNMTITIDNVRFHHHANKYWPRKHLVYLSNVYNPRFLFSLRFINNMLDNLNAMRSFIHIGSFQSNAMTAKVEFSNNSFINNSVYRSPFIDMPISTPRDINFRMSGNIFRNNLLQEGRYKRPLIYVMSNDRLSVSMDISENEFINNVVRSLIFVTKNLPLLSSKTFIRRNKFMSNKADTVIDIRVNGAIVQDNVFVNPDSPLELSAPLVTNDNQIASFKVDARRNYWGVNNVTAVNSRIASFESDMRRWVVYREPFYLSEDLTMLGNVSAFIDGDSVGGLVDGDTEIPTRARPYTVDRSILVSPGSRLKFDGVKLEFLTNRGIFVEGDIDASNSELRGGEFLRWKGVFISQKRWYTNFVRLDLGPGPDEGILVLTIGQNSGYVCQYEFDVNDANVVCRMLGYSSGMAKVIQNAHSVYKASDPVYWYTRYRCNGQERSLFDCFAYQTWCNRNAVAGMKCYGPRDPSVNRSTSDSQLAHTLISGASTGLYLMSGNINITGVTVHNATDYGILVKIDSYHELDLHGSRVTECREGEAIHVKAKNGISLKSVTVDRNKDGIIINRENGSIRVSHVKSSMNARKSLWIDQTKEIMPSHVTIEHSVFEHQVENSEAVTGEFCNFRRTTPRCSLLVNNNVFRNNSGQSLKIYTGSQYSGGGLGESKRAVSINSKNEASFPVNMIVKFNTFDDCSVNIIDSNAVSKLSFENNNFMGQTDCADSVKDECLLRVDNREQADDQSMFMITENKFKDLTGRCAVSLSSMEEMIGDFQFNQLTDNKFFSEVLKLETSMYNVTDNIFDNRDSLYEVQVYSTDKNINATNNWFGSKNLSTVEDRLYHKNDNKNRARLLYVPIMETPTYDCSGVANCSNNGECVRRNRCRCNYGYKGVLCNEFDCSDRMDCYDHGSCTAPQTCSCIAGWRGRDCIEPVCDGLNDCLENAGRGFCVAPNKCQCGRKYSGDDCSGCAINNWGPLCLPCPGCVNGVCDKNTGECICSSNNWRGTLCNQCAEKFYGPRCLPLTKILDIVPSSGPDIGGKLVNIEGHNFEPTVNNTYYCRFGCCTKVKGVRLSDEHIQCITPKLTATSYYIDVSPDGVHNFTNSRLIYTFYARCPKTACGFQKKPSHGRCTFGQCVCYRPWTGDDCELELLKPIIIRPPDVTVLERNMYSVQVNLTQGNATLYWSMTPRLLGLTFDSRNGLIEWQSAIASATPYTFTVRVSNNIGSDVASWTVTVPLSYSAIIDNISPSGVLPSPKSVLVTGHVVFVDPRNTAKVVAVNVKLSNKGRIRTVSTLTGYLSNGEFVTWVHPRSSDSGTVLLGAHHPADRSFKAQKSWSVQRMITDPSYSLSYSTYLFDRNKITIPSIAALINDGIDDILNVTVTVSGAGGPLTSVRVIEANSTITDSNMFIANLSAGQRVPFDLLLTLTGPLSSSLVITFSSSRGTYVTLRVYLSITVRKPRLVLDPGSIRGNILIGSQKSYDIVVKNVGLVRANDVKVSLPIDSHFSISSFSKTNSTGSQLTLNPNEEATLTMTVTVNRGEPLGEIRGSIAIVSLTGGVSLRYHFFIVSDNKVNLTIVTEDEFTYFASNKPPLANATVRLWSRKRGVDISYITDETGIVVFGNIFEDMYSLSGSADGHGSKHTTILVTDDPKHTFVRLFLPRIAVKYTFTVKPTMFEDKYVITLESTFETQVPMPVVTIKPKVVNLIPYEEGKKGLMEFEVSNHGLIRADNVRFELPTNHPSLKFNLIGDLSRHLEANTTLTIQVGVSVRKVTKRKAIACGFINIACGLKMLYDYVCNGPVTRSDSVNFVRQVPGQPPHPCQTAARYCRGGGGGGGGGTRGIGGGGRPSSGGSVTVYNPVTPMSCKCAESLILDCLLAFHPFTGCAIATGRLAAPGGEIAWEIADFAMACGIGVFFPITGALYTAARCLMGVNEKCHGGSSSRRRRAISSAVVNAAIDSAVPMDNFIKLTEEVFGGKDIFFTRDDAWFAIFKGAVSDDSDADQILTENEHRQIMAAVKVTDAATISKFLTRWNNTMTVWNSGATPAPGANVMSRSFLQSRYTRFVQDNRAAKKAGHDSIFAQFDKAVSTYNKQKEAEGNKPDEGVCAKVRVRIVQELVLTRSAFNARLEIENGEASTLEDIKVTLSIQDSLKPGIIVNHLFAIAKPKLVGITAVDGTGSLAKSVSGSADWLMAPYPDSARSVDVLYQVGGRLSYRVGDSNFSVSLLPDTITVKPTPSLEVRYYHQKYVFGDDAMTKDIVEPIEPFFLAMTIANVGYGTARSVRITSAQPEIIENEKGLLITFEIIGSQLGNKPATKSLKMNFGDIEASETKSAKWILTSTLSGKFYNLTATFENINPFGDPELSILDVLEYHELFQLVFIEGEDDLDDFLVNDVIDEFVPQVPDHLCSSYNGSLCYNVTHTFVSLKHPLTSQTLGRYVTVTVVVETADSRWMYTRIEDDPVIINALAGDRRLLVVNRTVDGKTLLVGKNAWVTTRIEDKVLFHMLDYLPGGLQRNDGSMQYNLTVYELLFGPNITTTTSTMTSTLPDTTSTVTKTMTSTLPDTTSTVTKTMTSTLPDTTSSVTKTMTSTLPDTTSTMTSRATSTTTSPRLNTSTIYTKKTITTVITTPTGTTPSSETPTAITTMTTAPTTTTTPPRIPIVLRIRPNSGTNRGGDVIRVFGEHFDITSDNTYFCRFSSTLVTGTRISSEEIRCVAPAVDPQFEGMVTVEVSPDGTNNFTSSQVMYKYYIPCLKSSCGSEFTPTRGSCIFGTCRCNLPWSGDGCDIELMPPVIISPPGVTLNEAQRYTVNVTLSQGDEPLTWRIQNNLPGLSIDSQSGQVLWTMAVASQQPYTFTVVVTNQIGSDSGTWVVTVPLSYSVFIDTIEPGGALPYPQPIIVSGHFVLNRTFDPQPPLIAVLKLSNNDEVWMKTVYGDDAGRLDFKTVLYPRSSDGGKFLLGAHHPADTSFYSQMEYWVKKMILSKSSISLNEYLDGRSEIRLSAVASLSNVGLDPIPNISVTVEGVGGPLTSVIIVQQGSKQTTNLAINSLKPGQSVTFDLVLTVSAPLISSLVITFMSSEGTVAFMSASISLNQRLPLLSLNVREIRANIEIGTQETFDVLIRNDGNTTAKNIQISLPDSHMSFVSFAKDGDDSDKTVDLTFGEIATLSFSVTVEPTEGFGFITGDIVISSGGARSSLQYRFDFVSMKTVNLTVKIEDEFTYFATNGPRVSGATVVLINPRREIREVLVTPESGIVVFSDIVEDLYTVQASADGHGDAQVTVLVTSTDGTVALFLQRIAVKYTWTVTPTTIPDKYIIQLESTFETNVPMPVVTVKPKVVDIVPYEKGEKTQINFIVTNHGLISADNIRFNLPTNHESLIFTEVGEAANHVSPNTSVIITVKVTRRDAAAGRRKRGVISCLKHFVCALEMLWDYICNGPRSRTEEITLVRGGGGQPRPCYTRIQEDCGTQRSRYVPPRTVCYGCNPWRRRISRTRPTGTTGISIPIRPGRSSSTTYNPTRPLTCDCVLALIVDCGLAFHPVAGCVIAGVKVIHQGNDDNVPLELLDLVMACAGGSLGPPYTAIRCLQAVKDECGGKRRKRAVTRAVVESAIQSSDAMDNFYRLAEEVLGGTSLLYMEDTSSWYTMFKEKITDFSDAGRMLTDAEHAAILASVNATSYRAGVTRLLDRWNNTMSVWNGGQTMSLNVMDKSVVMSRYEQYSRDTRDAVKDGSQSIFGKFQDAVNTYNKQKDDENKKGDGVCAKVRVRIEQELVLTRSAFKARLEIENGEKSDLEGIMVTIEIRDTSRPHVVTTHLFSIGDPKLIGLTGVDGTGSLRRDTSGSAEWLMVPYPNSTQSADILYSVGGRLSYRVGAANFSVTLMPDTITVRPTPMLRVRYFLPMYVFGDDPMTPEVEAVEKFNLAMMVSNEGHGTARDVRITSAQPKIVENEKELLVTFKIIGAKLDDKAMSRTLKVEFGDIEPFMTKRADWVMTSSLSGKFYNLSATFVNINPLGDADLSILDVEYHELFRVVRMPDDYKGRHFLVNGKIDENVPQIPDRLYSSTNVSRVYDVYRAFLAKISQLQFTVAKNKYRIVHVTLNLTKSGWFYARVEHDLITSTHNSSHLLSVKRKYDDRTIPRENAWITSRMEKRILFHLLDYVDNSRPSDEVTYHLMFGSKQTSATARISYVAWSAVILAVSLAMQIACNL